MKTVTTGNEHRRKDDSGYGHSKPTVDSNTDTGSTDLTVYGSPVVIS